MKKTIMEWIEKGLACMCAALALASLFWIGQLYKTWGMDLWRGQFTETQVFASRFGEDVSRLETLLDMTLPAEWTDYGQEAVNHVLNEVWPDGESNFRYCIRVSYGDGQAMVVANGESLEDGRMKQDAPVYYRCLLYSAPDTNVPDMADWWFHVNDWNKEQVEVTVWMDNFDLPDGYGQAKADLDQAVRAAGIDVTAGAAAALGALGLLILLLRGEKKKQQRTQILYLEEQMAILALAGWGVGESMRQGEPVIFYILLLMGTLPLCMLIYGFFHQLFCRKPYGLRSKWLCVAIFYTTGRVRLEGLIGAALYGAAVGAGIYMAGIPIPVYLTGAWLVLYWIRHRIDEEAFIKAVERVGSGETYKEPGFKSRRYQQMGEAMERMADRIRKIVDQNVKAERLKADLITNVSHDLKTPLTSIITYTRLMEKEGGLSAKSSHYLKVLLDKSTQLKRLTEDLLDAAKITSGNETIHPQQLHFGEMVLQANGEFAEMMDEKNLDIISKVPSETMDAWIDGAKTWRILSNLYANACKYALPQTRVYVDVSENENEVCFCMKNISKEPLNIPPDELMERFVRGDRARSGGGNGLGLAISGDLAKLQGGRLELEISGDLFTARLYLPKYKKAEKGVDA